MKAEVQQFPQKCSARVKYITDNTRIEFLDHCSAQQHYCGRHWEPVFLVVAVAQRWLKLWGNLWIFGRAKHLVNLKPFSMSMLTEAVPVQVWNRVLNFGSGLKQVREKKSHILVWYRVGGPKECAAHFHTKFSKSTLRKLSSLHISKGPAE